MTGKVILEGLEFHAYHGVYAHERSSGKLVVKSRLTKLRFNRYIQFKLVSR